MCIHHIKPQLTYKIYKDFYEVQSLCDIRSDCFLDKQYRQAAETALVKSDWILGHNMAANFTKDCFSNTDLKIMNHFYMHHLLLLEVKRFFSFSFLYCKKWKDLFDMIFALYTLLLKPKFCCLPLYRDAKWLYFQLYDHTSVDTNTHVYTELKLVLPQVAQ